MTTEPTPDLRDDEIASHWREKCSHGMSAHDFLGCIHCACRTPGFGWTEVARDEAVRRLLATPSEPDGVQGEGLRCAECGRAIDRDSASAPSATCGA